MPEIAEKQTDIVDFLWRNDVVPGPAPGDSEVDAVWSKLPNYPDRLGDICRTPPSEILTTFVLVWDREVVMECMG
jgi:hypothetical protein